MSGSQCIPKNETEQPRYFQNTKTELKYKCLILIYVFQEMNCAALLFPKQNLTVNVPVVYMAQEVMILMGENPFQGPLEGVGPLPMARVMDLPQSK